ncbi:MAG: NADP-dependent oxidoreductase [Alphaproteobacteria bacterium]|nr:MAG: NADP-dependent oxidoreductase [Alphaproteobacteria bacterium]
MNKRVVLRRYPKGLPVEADFAVDEVAVPALEDGEILIRNLYFSLDAGFRNWMREGAGDNYLEAMALGAPVMSITLGKVERSRNPDFPVGSYVSGRHAWESYSVTDAKDFTAPLSPEPGVPLHLYMGLLGLTGLTAYFGLIDIGQPKPGEIVVVSAAAGAVGTVAGQMAKALGCHTVGITSTAEKMRWLRETVGYDQAVSYKDPAGIAAALKRACPDGLDIYFDNTGGEILDAALGNMREGARIILCGMVAQYHDDKHPPGPGNLWEAITKRATLKGFLASDHVDRYGEALARLSAWYKAGAIKSFDEIVHGIERTPAAFCSMFRGANKGKLIVALDGGGQ